MTIDPKDLMPLEYPIKMGGAFYLLQPDGSYELCRICEDDLKWPEKATFYRTTTDMYKKAGRLFVTRGRPYEAINQ